MKAVLYARVSSREQEETGYSLPAQKKLLQEYADRKNLRLVKTFSVAESASGKKEREVFAEMITYMNKHSIPNLLCEKVDRLTRNLKEAVKINDWVEENEDRKIHFVKQNLVIHKNAKSDEKFRWDIEIVLAKKYIANLSEEVKKGQKSKIEAGWLPTKPPLGYKTVGEKGHKIHKIDEEKAPFVKKMFELYATGNYSTRALVKEMRKRGLRNSNGGEVGKSRMHTLLSDPFYMGKIRWKGEIHRGNHEPLFSASFFEKVQTILKRKIANPQYKKHLPVFKAKMKCAGCGGTATWELQKGRWYGHCNHYKPCDHKKWVRQDRVEKQLFPLFDEVAPENEKVLRWIEQALKESHYEESELQRRKRDDITRSIERAEKRTERAYLDKLDGVVDSTLCKRIMDESKTEKEALLDALNALGGDQTAYYEAGYAIHELASKAQAIYENPNTTIEERRLLLSHVFSNLTLDDGEIRPDYTYAFEFLVNWVPTLNKTFELQKSQEKSKQKDTFVPSCPILLPELHAIRTAAMSENTLFRHSYSIFYILNK